MATTVSKIMDDFETAILNATEDFNLDESNVRVKSKSSLFIVDIYINYLATGCIAAFGSVANVISMIIFYRLGLKDSMSVGLMALSATDLLSSLSGTVTIGYLIMIKYFPDRVIEPLTINYSSIAWVRDLLFLCSAWITAILSLERCVCVVFPFKVKEIFTRRRCILAVVIIYIVQISANIPAYVSQWLVWSKVEVKVAPNTTVLKDRLVVKLAENRAELMVYSDIFTGAVLPIPAQVLVLISAIWMIHGLRVSARVRRVHTQSVGVDASKPSSTLSAKEVKLVKVVLFLAIILTLCMTPRFLAVYSKQIFPAVNYGNENAHIFSFLWNLATWGTTINASTNIFVYLIINSSYRVQFKAMFILGKEKT